MIDISNILPPTTIIGIIVTVIITLAGAWLLLPHDGVGGETANDIRGVLFDIGDQLVNPDMPERDSRIERWVD